MNEESGDLQRTPVGFSNPSILRSPDYQINKSAIGHRPSPAPPTSNLDEFLKDPLVRKAIEIFDADVVDVREEK